MKQLIPALFAVGAVMLLIGAAVYVTGWPLSPYIYTIGATFVALAQVNSPSKYKTSHYQASASPADIWSIATCAYRSFHVFHAWQRMDRFIDDCCYS